MTRGRLCPPDDANREGHKVCALLLMERGGLVSGDAKMSEARQSLVKDLENQKAKGGSERLAKAMEETEEKTSKADLDKILEEIVVTTGRAHSLILTHHTLKIPGPLLARLLNFLLLFCLCSIAHTTIGKKIKKKTFVLASVVCLREPRVERMYAHARVCEQNRTALAAGSLWFNLAMLFNHFWTITKLIFVYNNEPGYEHLKAEGYGNVPPDELEAQIQETIGIIKKLMTENIHSAIETLAKNLGVRTVFFHSLKLTP